MKKSVRLAREMCAGMSVCFGLTSIVGLAMHRSTALAQSLNSAVPKFEVAAIKPCKPDDMRFGTEPPTPGRIKVNCLTVVSLIRQSYVLFADGRLNPPGKLMAVEKAPAWAESDRYAIEAKAEGSPSQGTMLGPMMQALLEDRFKLKIHAENRDVPVYFLVVARDGAKLQKSQADSCVPIDIDHPPVQAPGKALLHLCKMPRVTADGFDLRGATLADLCRSISGRAGRDVIDKTGITGTYDFQMQLTPGARGPATPPPPPPSGEPPMQEDVDDHTAALQEALQKFGLNLKSSKGPGHFLVIDHVEKPSDN